MESHENILHKGSCATKKGSTFVNRFHSSGLDFRRRFRKFRTLHSPGENVHVCSKFCEEGGKNETLLPEISTCEHDG